ncbi:hypothetical protein FNF27_05186 [Cafeteria roenbergensis]|uniref:NADPH-dependent diflavin oxidoreductase 1 n=1 Tax=Cafeteria roenbergensis TaxID=33653 RepID=A0A5A8EBF2_CAFRO|nr:hypothetical protein FNF27_05186 [Cafeteria roenbergensis]
MADQGTEPVKLTNLLVLFGSQTGTAQDVAERIARQGENRGFSVQLSSMDGYLPQLGRLSKAEYVVFVASTTGDGAPPDNMREFWRVMTRADLPPSGLSSVRVAVLGLGDSSYSKFNVVARKLSVRLGQLGAQELCARGLADEQSPAGLEGDVDAWLRDSLWPTAIARFLPPARQEALAAAAAEPGGLDRPRSLATRFRVRRQFGAAALDADPSLSGGFLAGLAPAVSYGTAEDGEFEGVAPGARAPTAVPVPEAAAIAAGRASSTTRGKAEGTAGATCIRGTRGAVEAVVASNVRVSAAAWSQDTRAIRLNVAGCGIGFRAGDVCCVQPRNAGPEADAELRRLAARLGLRWSEVLEVTVREPALEGRMVGSALAAGCETAMSMLRSHQEHRLVGPHADPDSAVAAAAPAVPTAEVDPWPPGQLFSGKAQPLSPATRLPSRVSTEQLFTQCLDLLGRPSRSALAQLSFFATDEEEAEKLAELGGPGGGQLYCDYVEREARSWAEVLFDFPSVAVPLAHLLELVGPLRPREFSVAASPLRLPGAVDLCVAVVDFRTPLGRRKRGVCSSWLASLSPGARVAVWLRPGTLPPLCSVDASGAIASPPAILVGPGTGVAPIRALLQERAELLAAAGRGGGGHAAVVSSPGGFARAGEVAAAFPRLYFGCRSAGSDFYFKSDWWSMVAAGELGALRTAFSRDGGPDVGPDGKVYVQARIAQDADAVAHVLTHPQGRVVICGSAKRMPSDVEAVFVAVLQARKGMAAVDAKRHIGAMQAAGRYQVEAWS